ncbi:MAG: hypothetical protein HKN34_02840 [Gammaproteobacteria bacterium]|nr:hypothetical protein [Gammaproteobacteria bacterium]
MRSVMGWPQFYGPKSKGAYAIPPLDGDPYAENWSAMSRFEKVCWAWMETNEYLLGQIPEKSRFRLEDLVTSFDTTKNMLAGIKLDIDRESWRKIVTQPSRNANKSYTFPAWDDWDDSQKSCFIDICGSTMQKLGYRIE